MNRKSWCILFLVFTLFLSLFMTGCGNKEKKNVEEMIKVTDMAGRKVEVPKEVKEIVGVEPGALRLIVHLDAADKVVGVEESESKDRDCPYNLAHPEFKDLPAGKTLVVPERPIA